MSRLIYWWNNFAKGCDNDVVVCWGSMVLVLWCFWCIFWEVCCSGCVLLVWKVLVFWFLSFAWCVSVCLYWRCAREGLEAIMDAVGWVMVVWVLLVSCNWLVALGIGCRMVVGGINLYLNEWMFVDGTCVCARVDMCLVFGWKWTAVVRCSSAWGLVQVEVRFLWIFWL